MSNVAVVEPAEKLDSGNRKWSFSKRKALFSSLSGEWETPDELFAILNDEFHFDLDVCASKENFKVSRYFSIDGTGIAHDALTQDWSAFAKVCWNNPPYGRDLIQWVRKSFEEAQKGVVVVALLPARTDTKWFHEFVLKAAEIRFIRGRLTFEGAPNPAPFPSMIVVFRPKEESESDRYLKEKQK